jgi:hypothetical protein
MKMEPREQDQSRATRPGGISSAARAPSSDRAALKATAKARGQLIKEAGLTPREGVAALAVIAEYGRSLEETAATNAVAAREAAAAKAVAAKEKDARPNRGRSVKEIEKEIDDDRQATRGVARGRAPGSLEGAEVEVDADRRSRNGGRHDHRQAGGEHPHLRTSVDSVTARLEGNADVHDIMSGPTPGGVPIIDAHLLIRTLGAALDALGVERAWERPRELLAGSEKLSADAVALRDEAAQRYADAGRELAHGAMELAEFASVVGSTAPWLDSDIPSGRGSLVMDSVGHAAQAMRSNATALAHQEAPVLYQRLQPLAAAAVDVIASGPPIPLAVVNASDAARAAIAQGEDFARWWIAAQAAASRYEEVHRCAAVLREQMSAALGSLIVWPEYCASWAGPYYKGWKAAMEAHADETRRSTPSLVVWIRHGVDAGWAPGLWTAQDLVEQPPPAKPGLLARITGG